MVSLGQTDQTYTLRSTILKRANEEKDILVHTDHELSFDKYIHEKVNKPNSMFALLRRTFQYSDAESFVLLYKTLVRTHLEFANSIWHPYKIKHIDMTENVQRWATKQLPGFKDLSYSECLKKLKLPTLSFRRVRGDMIELYKILNDKYDREAAPFIKLWKDIAPRAGARRNSKTLYPQRVKSEMRKHSFAIRVVKSWNSLPEEIVSVPTTNSFKNRLDKYWSNQSLMYEDHKTTITGSGDLRIYDESNEEEPEGSCIGKPT